jgi:sugar lactone lactonase YvrE
VIVLPAEAGVEVTACAFGGEGMTELYITTCHKFWGAQKKAQLPLGGGLFKVSKEALSQLGPGIRGAPENHFKM